MDYQIDLMKEEDWEQVVSIYQEGIDSFRATFQSIPPTWESWDRGHLTIGRFVARIGSTIVGWIALSPTSARECFAGVVEVSIYIKNGYQGKGIGSALMNHVIAESEKHHIWSLYSAIIRDNEESIRLHEKCGFRHVGYRERIAKTPNGVWHDVIVMERRSQIVEANQS